jgi:hypothetical protein
MTTITQQQQEAIARFLDEKHIPSGLGTTEEACSIAAINLALNGELTDTIPDCMSEVIGKWVIVIQDAMPDEVRNSVEWRRLLPLAAGTGRAYEQERLDIILDWMWGTVLPTVQPVADEFGFGGEWRTMLTERTVTAARDAARNAYAATAAAYAARAAARAAYAAPYAARAAYAAAAARAAYAARAVTDADDYWQTVDPCGLLTKLIEVTP